jgi:glycosyltransferase involved in cell wall biosynthesis
MRIGMKILNEELTIKRCLADFHDEPWVSEIVIVDGRSSDFTKNEALKFNKVVMHEHYYDPSFHDQEVIQAQILFSYFRNGEIFFMLDADERMNPALKEFLAEVDKTNILPEGADFVHVARRTVDVMRYEDSPFAILGPDGWPIEKCECGQFPDFQPRLFRRSYKMHWVQSPHRVIMGFEKMHNLDTKCFIEHFEKDDRRQRDSIERRWLRPNATRKELGLPCDLYEAGVKPEYADAAKPEFWKDRG